VTARERRCSSATASQIRGDGFDFGAIRVPACVHHGEADTTVSRENAGRRFAEAIPGAQLRLHPCRGHFPLLSEAAGEVLMDVRQF
jgi:hypothetical protein